MLTPASSAPRGLLVRSPLWPRFSKAGLELLTPGQVRQARQAVVEHEIGGRRYEVALPITFTPFAAVQPCSARCRFCSETLVHRDAGALAATLRPGPGYFDGLERALAELRGLPLGVSLSGLEATDDAAWLEQVLDIFEAHEAQGGLLGERVLYSNGNGLAQPDSGERLLARLASFGLTRLELSRHHPDGERNGHIMRFRPGMPVGEAAAFESVVRRAQKKLPVRLVCVVQRGGVDSGEEVEAALRWAASLGVHDVVFRELSQLGDLYQRNAPYRYISDNRVPIEALIEALWPTAPEDARITPEALVSGYYYWSLRARWGDVAVSFETSDYTEMKALHHSDRIYKLIFHGNGNLCADWDPETAVLLRTAP